MLIKFFKLKQSVSNVEYIAPVTLLKVSSHFKEEWIELKSHFTETDALIEVLKKAKQKAPMWLREAAFAVTTKS